MEGWLEKEIQEFGLNDIVKQYGHVPRDVAVQKQRESQVLLFLNWDDPQETGLYSLKIFEYLGARRPVLATGGSRGDVIEELLDETGAGIPAVTGIDIGNTLKTLYREYKMHGAISFRGDETVINKYNHREMTRQFVRILENLPGTKQG